MNLKLETLDYVQLVEFAQNAGWQDWVLVSAAGLGALVVLSWVLRFSWWLVRPRRSAIVPIDPNPQLLDLVKRTVEVNEKSIYVLQNVQRSMAEEMMEMHKQTLAHVQKLIESFLEDDDS